MKQNGYQNAAFGCFGLMPVHSVFYRSGNSYRNSVVSLCNTELLLISVFSPHLLQTRKKRGII